MNADPGEQTTLAVLQERARLLARPASGDPVGEAMVVITFTVAGRSCAIEVRHVRGLLASADISRLPWSPAVVAGVMNVRGEIVAVADAAGLLSIGSVPSSGAVVVLDTGDHLLGLLVDSIDGLTPVTDDLILTAECSPAGVSNDVILGITSSLIVLDAQSLFAHPHLTTNSQEA